MTSKSRAKKSVTIDESQNVTAEYLRVPFEERANVFIPRYELRQIKLKYDNGPIEDYKKAVRTKFMSELRKDMQKYAGMSERDRDNIRTLFMAYIDRDLADLDSDTNTKNSLPERGHFTPKNKQRVSMSKSKKGGKKRTRKNRTYKK
jgi:hypothetical protein